MCIFLLQLLHADKRREYLYQLQEFMVTDNSRNWRFRYELAEYVVFSSSRQDKNRKYLHFRFSGVSYSDKCPISMAELMAVLIYFIYVKCNI